MDGGAIDLAGALFGGSDDSQSGHFTEDDALWVDTGKVVEGFPEDGVLRKKEDSICTISGGRVELDRLLDLQCDVCGLYDERLCLSICGGGVGLSSGLYEVSNETDGGTVAVGLSVEVGF